MSEIKIYVDLKDCPLGLGELRDLMPQRLVIGYRRWRKCADGKCRFLRRVSDYSLAILMTEHPQVLRSLKFFGQLRRGKLYSVILLPARNRLSLRDGLQNPDHSLKIDAGALTRVFGTVSAASTVAQNKPFEAVRPRGWKQVSPSAYQSPFVKKIHLNRKLA